MGKVARPAQGPAPQERRLITQGAKSEQGRCTLHSHPAGGLAEAGGGPAPTLSHLLLSALPFLAPHGGSLKGPRALPAIARKCQAPPCGQQRWLLGVQDRRPLVVEVPAPSSGNVGTAVTSNFPGATFKKKKKQVKSISVIHFIYPPIQKQSVRVRPESLQASPRVVSAVVALSQRRVQLLWDLDSTG